LFQYFSGEKKPTWLVFSGLGSQWAGMGSTLFKFPVFASLVHKCQKALKQYNVDLADILCDKSSNVHRNAVYALVGLTTMQVNNILF
jgi:fatty acid synthase